jgi:hypothetical protein
MLTFSLAFAGLKVQYSSTKGFYLLVPSQHISGNTAGAAAGGGDSDAVAAGRRQLGRGGAVPQLPK